MNHSITTKVMKHFSFHSKELCSSIVAFVLFFMFDPSMPTVLVVSISILAFLIVRYSHKHNKQQFTTILLCCFLFESAFLLSKFVNHHLTIPSSLSTIHWLHLTYAGVTFMICLCSFFRKTHIPAENTALPSLYPAHQRDLERVIQYLGKFSIVGIDGDWGSGKTLLVKHLSNDNNISSQYRFAHISLMSCTIDDIQTVIIHEIERILLQSRILSFSSSQVRSLSEKNDFSQVISSFLVPQQQTYAEALQSFCQDLNRLEHKIIVVVEDIDRVKDSDTIRKLFCIAENLTSSTNQIKFIFEYSQNNLHQLDEEFTRSYIEKYIPFTVSMTNISFQAIVKQILHENQYPYINEKVLSFLWSPVGNSSFYVATHIMKSIQFDIPSVSVRRVSHFLDELNILIGAIRPNDDKVAKVITMFCYIKHFDDKAFERLHVSQDIITSFAIRIEDYEITIPDLIIRYHEKQINDTQLQSALDQCRYFHYLMLMEYDFTPDEHHDGLQSCRAESLAMLKRDQHNEMINRIFWNLLSCGKSSITNKKAMVELLEKEVLLLPSEKQYEAYTAFHQRCYDNDLEELHDNTTPFMIGDHASTTIFKSLAVCNDKTGIWKKYLDFYFTYRNSKSIDHRMIVDLQYCPIDNRDVFVSVLSHFNKCAITGNLNQQSVYWEFLIRYISTSALWMIPYAYEIKYMAQNLHNEQLKTVIPRFLKELKERFQQIEIPVSCKTAYEHLSLMVAFIDKNILIIENPTALQPEDPIPFRIEYPIVDNNTTTHSRISNISDKARREQELDNHYFNRNITMEQMVKLINKPSDA